MRPGRSVLSLWGSVGAPCGGENGGSWGLAVLLTAVGRPGEASVGWASGRIWHRVAVMADSTPPGGSAQPTDPPAPQPVGPERRAAPDPVSASIVLGLAVGVFGISFGVLAVASGLTVAQASAMSLLVFTGASQFAAVGVIGSGGSTAAAMASALLLAARNGAYGLSLSDVLSGQLVKRLLAAHVVIDESTAMATSQNIPADQVRGFWWAGLSVFVFWNLGTLVGALGGDAIGDPQRYGLDAAFPAGFVALVVPHLRSFDGKVAAAIGAGAALVLVPFAPAGLPVLVAALAVMIGLRTPAAGEQEPEVRPVGDPA